MSNSSVYKMGFRDLSGEATRIIDTNALVAQRLEALEEKKKQAGSHGFVAGLAAETVELPGGEDEDEALSGNVIKAGEDAQALLARASEEAEGILAQANEEAGRLLADAAEQAERTKEQVYSMARDNGYGEGRRMAEAEAEALRQQFAAKERQLEAEYQQLIDGLEPKFIDAITGIYEHIFHVELASYHDILTHLIAGAIRRSEAGRNFLVHVSREDYPHVMERRQQIIADGAIPGDGVEIIEDISLAQNQCLIETDGGIFDCGLGTQLEELGRRLRLLSYSGS